MEKGNTSKANPDSWEKAIFNVNGLPYFNELALRIFYFQAQENPIYRHYLELRGVNPADVREVEQIPFLPIEAFKFHRVLSTNETPRLTFRSSGTTGELRSSHEVIYPQLYDTSSLRGFQLFFGDPQEWIILALLPSYLERNDASLVYYTELLIKKSAHPESGFYLDKLEQLAQNLNSYIARGKKVLLLGVTFALLDLMESGPFDLPALHIMETGGMKGRRKELTRAELHQLLRKGFGTPNIYSEYGMTELLSQAYCLDGSVFNCPPWMQIKIREADDPYSYCQPGITGGINIIDLANVYSCSFIATQDLGKLHTDGSFEVIGRFDHSDLRGCNLMVL